MRQTVRDDPEALPRMTKNGLVVDAEGWFVLNARESRWKSEGPLGRYCNFEGKRRFRSSASTSASSSRARRSAGTTARTPRKASS